MSSTATTGSTAAPEITTATASATTKTTTSSLQNIDSSAVRNTAANSKPVQVKLVLLGEAAVGKSSIVIRFVSKDFQENKEPTIGAAFMTQRCRLDDTVIKYEIWDTAGQERFYSLAPMYYRNAAAAVVVYDITSATSLEKAKSWVKELQRQANRKIVIAFVGNKLDLANPSSTSPQDDDSDASDASSEEEHQAGDAPDSNNGGEQAQRESNRQVPREEAEAYANENGLIFFETSARTGENIVDVFTEIAKKIPIDEYRGGGRSGASGAGSAGRGRGAGSGQRQDGQVNLDQSESQQTASSCSC